MHNLPALNQRRMSKYVRPISTFRNIRNRNYPSLIVSRCYHISLAPTPMPWFSMNKYQMQCYTDFCHSFARDYLQTKQTRSHSDFVDHRNDSRSRQFATCGNAWRYQPWCLITKRRVRYLRNIRPISNDLEGINRQIRQRPDEILRWKRRCHELDRGDRTVVQDDASQRRRQIETLPSEHSSDPLPIVHDDDQTHETSRSTDERIYQSPVPHQRKHEETTRRPQPNSSTKQRWQKKSQPSIPSSVRI